jgi:hypothetical protein
VLRFEVPEYFDYAISHDVRRLPARKVPCGVREVDHQLVEMRVGHGMSPQRRAENGGTREDDPSARLWHAQHVVPVLSGTRGPFGFLSVQNETERAFSLRYGSSFARRSTAPGHRF